MIERRKYARLSIEADVKYNVIGQRHKGAETARCVNISPEGFSLIFRNAADIRIGAKLNIKMTIKGSGTFHMAGEVIWINGSGDSMMGVKILEIHSADENRFLLQLCDRMIRELSEKYHLIKL